MCVLLVKPAEWRGRNTHTHIYTHTHTHTHTQQTLTAISDTHFCISCSWWWWWWCVRMYACVRACVCVVFPSWISRVCEWAAWFSCSLGFPAIFFSRFVWGYISESPGGRKKPRTPATHPHAGARTYKIESSYKSVRVCLCVCVCVWVSLRVRACFINKIKVLGQVVLILFCKRIRLKTY